MNVPFSPTYLWPVPAVTALSAIWIELKRRARKPPRRSDLHPEQWLSRPSMRLLGAWLASRILALLAVSWALCLWKFALPPVHGRVVDLDTSQPVSDVTITRMLGRVCIDWILKESGPTCGAAPNLVATTGPDGAFRYPGWVAVFPTGLWGLTRIQLVVFSADHMPTWDCGTSNAGIHPLNSNLVHCSGLAHPMWPDPWSRITWRPSRSNLEIEVALRSRVGQEAPSEALRRVGVLRGRRLLTGDEFLRAVLSFLATHEVTSEDLLPLCNLTDEINPYRRPDLRQEWCRILARVERYCKEAPRDERCALVGVRAGVKDYLTDCLPIGTNP